MSSKGLPHEWCTPMTWLASLCQWCILMSYPHASCKTVGPSQQPPQVKASPRSGFRNHTAKLLATSLITVRSCFRCSAHTARNDLLTETTNAKRCCQRQLKLPSPSSKWSHPRLIASSMSHQLAITGAQAHNSIALCATVTSTVCLLDSLASQNDTVIHNKRTVLVN